MTLHTQNRMLWTLNVLLALAVVAGGAGLALWPIGRVEGDGAAEGVPPAATQAAAADTDLPLSAYAVLYEKDLLRPLYDAAPTVAAKTPPPKPTVTLVGTVIEQGFTYALLRTKDGQVKMVAAGQVVDGSEVTEITSDSTTVRFGGATHTLKIQKGEAGP